jgi:hypothetical protein
MRVEVQLASPEPAAGVFTPVGTCQGPRPGKVRPRRRVIRILRTTCKLTTLPSHEILAVTGTELGTVGGAFSVIGGQPERF